ncbi:MAG: hypothetical protein PVF99_03450, partial [Desulfobacterales bacterium]
MKKLEKQFYMISSDSSAKRIEQLVSIKKKSLAIVLGGYLFNLALFVILNHIFFEKLIDFIFLLKFATHLLGITLIYLLIVSLI